MKKTIKSALAVLVAMLMILSVTGCNSNGETDETKATNATEAATVAETTAETTAETQAAEVQADNSNDELVIPTVTGIWKHETNPSGCKIHVGVQNGNTIEIEISSMRGEGKQIATVNKTVNLTPDYFGDEIRGYAEFDYTDSFDNTGLCKLTVGENVITLVVEEETRNGTWGISNATGDYYFGSE